MLALHHSSWFFLCLVAAQQLRKGSCFLHLADSHQFGRNHFREPINNPILVMANNPENVSDRYQIQRPPGHQSIALTPGQAQ